MAETTDTTAAAEKAAVTRKTNALKRSTTAKKAAETRAANRGAAARATTERKTTATARRARSTAAKEAAQAKSAIKLRAERAADVAEKSVLVPVGAALITRDRVISAVEELRATYSTRKKTENELKRFERRGTSALKSIEKDVRSMIKDLETRTGPVVKNVELVSARVENAVQGGKTAATKASTTVQERLASLA
ncbi:MAG: hypothetical protein QOJ35_498 [Solirubrobacteraceae bacterium]|jgi:hypothetical protein|nr:hypothetical protein [Solirubrobacteraceae bacterium]